MTLEDMSTCQGSTSLNRRRCRSLFLSTTGLFGRGCFCSRRLCSHHYTLCNPFNLHARLEAEIAKPLIDTFMWQGFLVFCQNRYFQKSKTDGRNHQVSRLDVSGEGSHWRRRNWSRSCLFKMFTTVLWVCRDLCWFVVNLTCVKGMKRAGWTEVEIPEDLHEMVITWKHPRRGAPLWDFMAAQGRWLGCRWQWRDWPWRVEISEFHWNDGSGFY